MIQYARIAPFRWIVPYEVYYFKIHPNNGGRWEFLSFTTHSKEGDGINPSAMSYKYPSGYIVIDLRDLYE